MAHALDPHPASRQHLSSPVHVIVSLSSKPESQHLLMLSYGYYRTFGFFAKLTLNRAIELRVAEVGFIYVSRDYSFCAALTVKLAGSDQNHSGEPFGTLINN